MACGSFLSSRSELAVFHGGFRREAAEQIAGASLSILATLARKSLLHLELDGRYQIHELLRQYADERLALASSEEVIYTRDRHSTYYVTFLSERDTAMNGGRQLQATAEIHAILAATILMDLLLPLVVGGPVRAGRAVDLDGRQDRRLGGGAADRQAGRDQGVVV